MEISAIATNKSIVTTQSGFVNIGVTINRKVCQNHRSNIHDIDESMNTIISGYE